MELAVSLPALVLLLCVALSAIVAVRVQAQCVDAAREAARTAARGGSGEAAGLRVAPAGAQVQVGREADQVRATVRTRVRPLGAHLPGIEVAATAVAALEPGVGVSRARGPATADFPPARPHAGPAVRR